MSGLRMKTLQGKSAREAAAELTEPFEAAGVDEAALIAQRLAAEAFGLGRLEAGLRSWDRLSEEQALKLAGWAERICAGEPLQYVLGETEFLGRSFITDPRALIPRPETEELAAWALGEPEVWAPPNPWVADVGTGTGCMAISLALERPQARLAAVDLSDKALSLARENAARWGVESRLAFHQADLLAPFEPGTLDAVVSNPPYIRSGECELLPRHIREREPRMALDGGADGLFLISRLVKQAAVALKSGGRIFLEIGEDQGAPARRLLMEAGFVRVEIRKDLNQHDRMAGGVKP